MTVLVVQLVAAVTAAFPAVHHHHPRKPMQTAVASWYDEHGTGACAVGDVQQGLRFASLFLPCGAQVWFCHAGRCAVATMSDHGPYADPAVRKFDLNANLNVILRCGLCSLRYRVVSR
jgi:hypothetical protein